MADATAEASTSASSHGSTLFVSNLPYTATSVDLQTLFSDVGPVRSAFIVQDKETKVSKGVGYVSFAIREDAQRALDDPSSLVLDGRPVRLQWPGQKLNDASKKAARPMSSKSTTQRDPLALRTIVISGLPADVNSKVLWKKVRKEDGADSVQYPVEGASVDIAHAVFQTPAQALAAAAHLHAHVFKGAVLSVTPKHKVDGLKRKKDGAPSRNNRLIIRNLPFDATEAMLRATFLPYGPIHSIDVPNKDEEGKSKGFAFVWFIAKTDAAKALDGANGKPLRTTLGGTEKRKGKDKEARVIAVDWALSKSRWEAEKAKFDDAMDEDDAEGSGSSGSSSEDSVDGPDDDESLSDTEDALGVHGSSDESSEDSDHDEEEDVMEDDTSKPLPVLPQTDVGTTLFVRNVPYDATEDDLRTLFRAFGPLRYARITMDHESGRSRGTGFACFWNKADADAVIEHAQLLRDEIGDVSTEGQSRKNPFSMPSILTPDPSSSLARTLVLHGRTLDVTRAVTREQAGRLKEEGERKREKADKRNLYLMREGVIFPNSPAAAALPPTELEKRQASYNARRTLLRSNPSLYVSRTRLSVRQLPPWTTERVLRKLSLHAIREFGVEVKAGTREALADDELHPPEREDDDERQLELKIKSGKRASRVLQAKIVRQHDRLDPVTGKGRSRGYGFIQLATHADALRVLRWANNNPAAESLMHAWFKDELQDALKKIGTTSEEDKALMTRVKAKISELEGRDPGERPKGGALIMEFSIENLQVIKKRREKQETDDNGPKAKKRSLMDEATTDEAPTRDRKRRRLHEDKSSRKSAPVKSNVGETESQPSSKLSESHQKKTSKNNLGSIIGRKRKERKAKRV